MPTIKRNDFLQQFKNQSLDLSKIDGQVARTLESAGSSTAKVTQADLNNDGKISGADELKHLFRHMDDFDRNGSSQSFLTHKSNGQQTASGKVYSALSLLFSEAANVASTASTTSTTSNAVNEFGQRLAQGGAESIANKMGSHLKSIEETGVGIYYGDHSSLKGASLSEKRDWIATHAKSGTTAPQASELKESSCIGWAMDNVKAAYVAAGKEERWNQIFRTVVSQGSKGTDLAKELQKDGWEAVYWNPDSKTAADGNAEHTYTAAITKRGKPYYGINIDHRVTDYRPTESGNTGLDNSGLEKLREVPFFFGLAKGGMHTFVGREGKVNEFHWTATPNDTNAIEERPLEKFPWLSGVIMIPPGTWPK